MVFELAGTPQAAADAVTLWAARGSLFACAVPEAKPEVAARQERRRYDHRQAAAAFPDLDATAVPPQAAGLAAGVDPAMLCWFFPRERGGRYHRSAVVALAPCRDGRLHLSGPWLGSAVIDKPAFGNSLTFNDSRPAASRTRRSTSHASIPPSPGQKWYCLGIVPVWRGTPAQAVPQPRRHRGGCSSGRTRRLAAPAHMA